MPEDTQDPMQESSNVMMKALEAVFVTKAVFLESFKKAMDIILTREKALNEMCAAGMAECRSLFYSLKDQLVGEIETAKNNMVERVDAALADQESGMNFLRDKMRNIKTPVKGVDYFDGKDPDEAAIVESVLAKIPKDPEETPEETRDKLETLQGKERLKATAIDGLEELIAEANKKGEQVKLVPGGPRGMFIYIGGVKKGIISNMNLVPGTNMAIAFSMVSGQPTLTFNASSGGSGTTVETPAGTIDPDNLQCTFTPTSRPKWVVSDGTTYYEGAGYAWDGTNVIMDFPPSSFIRDIY